MSNNKSETKGACLKLIHIIFLIYCASLLYITLYLFLNLTNLPQNVINAYNVLFVGIFGITNDSCTGLNPRITTIFVHNSIIMR